MRYLIDSVLAVLLIVLVFGGLTKGQERLCSTVISPYDESQASDEPPAVKVVAFRKVMQQVCDGKTCRMVEVEVPDYPRVPADPPVAPALPSYFPAASVATQADPVQTVQFEARPRGVFFRNSVRGPFRGFFARLFCNRNR